MITHLIRQIAIGAKQCCGAGPTLTRLRFWLPAPDDYIFVTQIEVKSEVLKTEVNNLVFLKCTYFFFQFLYKL